jgi:2-polyprenyl-3-methyl-5-hydroxy-6-metoxy-1,4-benzoquinol methylase
MSDSNIGFYTNLVSGKIKRKKLGMQKRFAANDVVNNPSIIKYLIPFLKKYIGTKDRVLDFGCGPGTFIPLVASMAHEVHGLDIVPAFIDVANKVIAENNLQNAFVHLSNDIPDTFIHYFDVVIMIDVLHHMDAPLEAIKKCAQLLRKDNGGGGGILLILEQNRRNPATFIVHALDSNERRVLRMGCFTYYRKLLSEYFTIEEESYDPLVIGYSSKIVRYISNLLNAHKLLRRFLPRLRFVCRNYAKEDRP